MSTQSPGTPRARPRSLRPAELGFRRRRPVAWLSPMLLVGTAVRLAGAYFFGAYLDKRELQGVLSASEYDHSDQTNTDGDFWLDYVADLGDGFDATYSVAWLVSQPSLDVGDDSLPRGQVLVMGGDQVYPTAGYTAYEDRFQGPYQAAMPSVPGNDDRDPTPPSLYALPGNHDWYDGLTAFLRMFGRGRAIGGRQTRQSRSYFALKLPHRWWLFAVDGQLSSYIDEPQLAYFRQVASDIRPGDRVVLCVSEPDWIRTPGNPNAYTTIDYFRRTVIDPTGASCEIALSGDRHHYAHYVRVDGEPARNAPPDGQDGTDDSDEHDPDTATDDPAADTAPGHLITCGGGGAYLADTTHLPSDIQAPSARSTDPYASRVTDYRLQARYPSRERSRGYGRGIFGAILRKNPGFSTFVGIVHVLLLMAFLAASEPLLAWISVGVSVLVVLGTTALAGKPKGDTTTSPAVHRALGILHGLAQLGLASLGAVVWTALPFDTLPWVLPGLTAFVLYGPVIAILGSELVALYLWVAGRFAVNVNELYAAQGIEHDKAFLRMCIAPNGTLTIYPVGVNRVCHRWRATPNDPPQAPWIAPEAPLTPHLIEQPIRVQAPERSESPTPTSQTLRPTPAPTETHR